MPRDIDTEMSLTKASDRAKAFFFFFFLRGAKDTDRKLTMNPRG